MCTYTSHIRICARCARQETVLISEQLCLAARSSGIFGSCLEGVLGLRDTTACRCWGCREEEGGRGMGRWGRGGVGGVAVGGVRRAGAVRVAQSIGGVVVGGGGGVGGSGGRWR